MKKRFDAALTAALLTVFLMAVLPSPVLSAAAYLPGDVNGNGIVEAEDARLALRASVALEHYTVGSDAFRAADANRDGAISSDDARLILRASVRLETLYSAPAFDYQNSFTEFNYLKNGNFYLRGTLTDASGYRTPLEMAVTPDSVYMLSDFDGVPMGMLVNRGKAYMIWPDKKIYLEMSPLVMNAMGLSADDLADANAMDYSQYDLARADAVSTETVNGVSCTVFIFNNSTGSTRFFLNGSKLVRFATYDRSGRPDTVSDVSYITGQVPADRIAPPKNYKRYWGTIGMLRFIDLVDGG